MINIDKRTEKRKLGDVGENIACDFLKSKGFEIVERNYLKKWGEIDIVARKGRVMRFVEVKSVNHETLMGLEKDSASFQQIRPEENMHPGKIKRLARTIETYMLHKKLDCEFQLDLVTVKMNSQTRQARVELFENIII
jgi:putative endonuclease